MNKIPYEARKEIYQKALSKFGLLSQMVVALEELSECQKEICKCMRGIADLDHLAEEIADATIMLEQMRLYLNLNDAVSQKMDEKVLRLEEKISKDGRAATELQEWISVKDRLPKPYVDVVACRQDLLGRGNTVGLEYISITHDEIPVWSKDYMTWKSKVTHWMPLPQSAPTA